MSPTTLYETDKPARQFSDAVRLPSANCVLGDQFAADSEGDSTSKNKVECVLLVHAAPRQSRECVETSSAEIGCRFRRQSGRTELQQESAVPFSRNETCCTG